MGKQKPGTGFLKIPRPSGIAFRVVLQHACLKTSSDKLGKCGRNVADHCGCSADG